MTPFYRSRVSYRVPDQAGRSVGQARLEMATALRFVPAAKEPWNRCSFVQSQWEAVRDRHGAMAELLQHDAEKWGVASAQMLSSTAFL